MKVILFDIGGVLVKYNHNKTCRKLSKFCCYAPDKIYNIIYPSKLMVSFEEGKLSPTEFFRKVSDKLGLKMSFKDFKEAWEDIYTLNGPVGGLMVKLSKKHRIFILSNTDEIHYKFTYSRFSRFLSVADKILVSYKMGMRKPDPRIFKKVLKIIKTRPEDLVYVDDFKENVESAAKLGIKSIHYTTFSLLVKELRKHGIGA